MSGQFEESEEIDVVEVQYGLDAAPARASIFFPAMLLENVLDLDDIDLLALLELSAPLAELTAAARANFVRGIEIMRDIDDGQVGLIFGTMPRFRLLLFLLGLGVWTRPSLTPLTVRAPV